MVAHQIVLKKKDIPPQGGVDRDAAVGVGRVTRPGRTGRPRRGGSRTARSRPRRHRRRALASSTARGLSRSRRSGNGRRAPPRLSKMASRVDLFARPAQPACQMLIALIASQEGDDAPTEGSKERRIAEHLAHADGQAVEHPREEIRIAHGPALELGQRRAAPISPARPRPGAGAKRGRSRADRSRSGRRWRP